MHVTNKSQDTYHSTSSESIPQLVLTSSAHIRVESLSWMDVIRRKYQVNVDSSNSETEGETSLESHERITRLGRTASANKRALELLKLKETIDKHNSNE